MSEKELSIILLDNSARERFHTLDWLSNQTVARDRYELIWVEVHDRVVQEVKDKVDHYLTLHQVGLHHKHAGVNAGIIQASGRIVTMCDSDAVYPPEFVQSVIDVFAVQRVALMHYEERSTETYPDGQTTIEEIKGHSFSCWPNVGACNSVLRRDAIGFGGIDEHESYMGILAGQNELLWRMINSGVPEVWHELHIYHFRHPGSDGQANATERHPSSRDYEMHNATAVEAFREGRLLPLVENAEIHRLRMEQRIIGTDFERKYA